MSNQPARTYDWSNGVEVKACPFCGSDDLSLGSQLNRSNFVVYCNNFICRAEITRRFDHVIDAIAVWNRRASDELVATLTKALEILAKRTVVPYLIHEYIADALKTAREEGT